MGKRNRGKYIQPKSSPPDGLPYSTGVSVSSELKLLQSIEPTEPLVHQIATHNVTEASMKMLHYNPSIPRHNNYTQSRSLFSKQSQHQPYGHHYHYSRRRSNNHASTSGPYVKSVLPVHDEKLHFKLPSQTIAEMQYQADKLLNPDNRIRFNPMEMETNIPDPSKMALCIICHKSLRRKPGSGATLSSSDVSVVAVLVCGHLYHAQCLEQNTSPEHLHDPTCPLCSGMLAGSSSASHDAYAS